MTDTWRTAITVFLFLAFVGSIGHLALQFSDWQQQSPSTRMSVVAWDLFNSGDYKTAITVGWQCGDDFRVAAAREEGTLAKSLPTGKVSPEEAREIFDNGVLNDVATCFWIAGRSAQRLRRNDEARAAYTEVIKYQHARTFDAKSGGFFWAPAEDAQDRLRDLQ